MSEHGSPHPFHRRLLLRILLSGFLLAAGAPGRIPADDALPAGAETATGRLAGSVEIGPQLDSRRIRFNLYSDPAARPAIPAPAADAEMSNVVIYFQNVEAAASRAAEAPQTPMMRQEGLQFVPHVLVVEKGQTVSFPNADPIFHNVFSLSRPASFDLGRYPRGESKSIRFDEPGMVKVFCHLHSDMSGIILVVENPWFAIPDARGHYAIEDIPPGTYTVNVWHERVRPLSTQVRIEPGRTRVLDLKIPLTESTGG